MARAGSTVLDSGQPFPAVAMETVAHGRVSLPGALGDGFGVVVLYRAHW